MCVCLHMSVLRTNLPLQVFPVVIDRTPDLTRTIFSPFFILQVTKSWVRAWELGYSG